MTRRPVLRHDEATQRTDERPGASEGTKSFECQVTYVDDRARVTAKGCLDVSTVPVLRRVVLAAAVLPISGVTLDLAGVESLDRYAVNALVALRRQVRDHSAAFSLASVSPPARRALDAAGIREPFDHESLWSSYPRNGA